jgi:hypothetical protein
MTTRVFEQQDDKNTDGGTVYKHILINDKLKAGTRGKKKQS